MRKGIITAGGATLRAVEIDFAVEHFLARKAKRGHAANTLRAYAQSLADLQAYLAGHGITLIGLIAERHVEGWADDMAARKIAPRSIALRLTVLRQLIAHALTETWITHDPAASTRVRFRPKRVIAPEVDAIRAMIDRIAPIGWQNLRDRALLSLAFDAGLRAGEVCALDTPGPKATHTVDLERRLVHVPAKGGGDETVCIGDTTAARVRDWLAARPDSADRALFVSQRRARFTRQALYFLVKRRGAAAGIVVHPHLLRHRRVGDVVERMGLDVGRGFARHSHTSTTANVYGGHAVQVIHQRIREAGDPLAGRVGA